MKSRKSSESNVGEAPSVLFVIDNDEAPKSSTTTDLVHHTKKSRASRKRSTVAVPSGKRHTTKRRSTKRATVAPEHRKTTAKFVEDLSMSTTITCDANHEGRLLLRANLQLAVDKLFEMLFTSKSTFLSEFHRNRNTTELQMGEWQTNQDGEKSRVVSMVVALQAAIGPKSAKVIENHKMRSCSAKGQLYSIDVESVNEGIPHADVFTILMHYCLTRSNENTTDIVVFGNVNFIKSTWAVIKAFITKHSYEGMAEFFHSLNQELLKEVEKKQKN